MRGWAITLLALAAASSYTERLHIVPYTKTTSLSVFSFDFSYSSSIDVLTNYEHFPAFLPTLLATSRTDYFSVSLVHGQTDPSVGEILSTYNEIAGTQFQVKETGLYVQASLETIWDFFAPQLSALICSPLSAFTPFVLRSELYLHAHDFNCKENLISVIKLLPCRDSRGLGQLLTDSLYNMGYMHIIHSGRVYKGEYSYHIEVMAEVLAVGGFRAKTSNACLDSLVVTLHPDMSLRTQSFPDVSFPDLSSASISVSNQCIELKSERRFGGEMHGFEAWYQHTLENCFLEPVDVTVSEHFPTPVTPLLHTLILSQGTWSVEKLDSGWLVTVCARIEPGQGLKIKLRVVKQMQQFEKYPNDPQRGWDVQSMPIYYELAGKTREQLTARLLLMVPEPDFSMPFNVMCVTGCLISFFFTTIQTFTLNKDPTHWSSPRYHEEVVKAEAVKTWARRIFLAVSIGTVYLLDRYGVVKLFG